MHRQPNARSASETTLSGRGGFNCSTTGAPKVVSLASKVSNAAKSSRFTTCRLLYRTASHSGSSMPRTNQNEGTAITGFYAACPRLKLDAPATGLSREKFVVAPLPVSRGRLATAGAEVVGAGGAGCTSTA